MFVVVLQLSPVASAASVPQRCLVNQVGLAAALAIVLVVVEVVGCVVFVCCCCCWWWWWWCCCRRSFFGHFIIIVVVGIDILDTFALIFVVARVFVIVHMLVLE